MAIEESILIGGNNNNIKNLGEKYKLIVEIVREVWKFMSGHLAEHLVILCNFNGLLLMEYVLFEQKERKEAISWQNNAPNIKS